MSRHAFADSGRTELGPSGRRYRLCAVCGARNVGTGHTLANGAGAATPATPAERAGEPRARPQAPAPTRKVADWRIHLLRHAVELVRDSHLELEAITAIRLEELHRALRSELYGSHLEEREPVTPADVPRPAPAIEPPPVPGPVSPLANERARRLLQGIRGDKQRELVRRAIAAGWRHDRTGGGHIRLWPADGSSRALTVSCTALPQGHGWRNLRAAATAAGLDTSGL